MEQTIKTAVSLPKKLFQQIEESRSQAHIDRSKFFRIALQLFLEGNPNKEENKIASLYQQVRETDKALLNHYKRSSYKHLPAYNEREQK